MAQVQAIQGYPREGRLNLPSKELERGMVLQFVWRLMSHRFNKELRYAEEQVNAVIQHYFL